MLSAQDTGDLLDERYSDGLEAMLVAEDKVFLKLVNNAATCLNSPYYFSDFTPVTMQNMKTEIASNGGIPVTSMLELVTVTLQEAVTPLSAVRRT